MLDKLKSILSSVAPALATAFGGPLAGVAVSALSQSLLGKTNASDDDILKSVMTPDGLLRAKEAEMQFVENMSKIGLDREKIEQLNVDNARSREVELARAGKRDFVGPLLAFSIVAAFFCMLAAIWNLTISSEMKPIADTMIGTLGAQFVSVCNYYFGSSHGSRAKDEIIANGNVK